MKLASDAASNAKAPMPALDLLVQRFQSLQTSGRGTFDASTVASLAAEEAGLKW
jgi:3-hydroxyisobutyrate dehydrogenase-like beta-hydroxyacid dehydrogenase